jgi:hypothetical protein
VPHQRYASDPAGFAAWLGQVIAPTQDHAPRASGSGA